MELKDISLCQIEALGDFTSDEKNKLYPEIINSVFSNNKFSKNDLKGSKSNKILKPF